MSTSGSTPPLSRQPSREEMDASSEDVDTGQTANQSPLNPTQQKVVDPAPKLSARPRAGTWVAAVVSPDAGSPRAPAAANQKSTEPRLAPRGPLPDLPKPPSSKVPSTSNLPSATLSTPTPSTSKPSTSKPSTSKPSTSKPSTSTPSTSTSSAPTPGASVPSTSKPPGYIKSKVPAEQIPADLADALRATYQGMKEIPDPYDSAKMIQVPVFNLPPKQIARLMVGLESNFGKNIPSQDNLSKPLRDRFGISGFQVNSNLVLDHINVILGILAPFMQRMFDSLESEQARVGVREQFDAFASGPHKNLLQKEEGKDLRKEPLHNISFREKFQSVMQPLQSFIYGTDRTLESSQVPRDLKLFLKEMPKIYAAWGEQQDIAAKDLVGMIKSALIGMLFIRGLLPVWNDKFQAELTEQKHSDRAWSKNKEQLSALLGSYTSFLFDDFILAIIATADGKSPALAQYFKSIEKAAELRRKEALVAGKKQEKTKRELTRGATVSNSKSGNSEKRSNFGQFIQGLISPRKKESATSGALPTSPRSTKASERVQSAEGVLLKKTQARPNNVVRTQRRALDQYLKSIKLPNYDPGFIRHLSEAIAKRENYEDFESAPAAFCLLQLDEYVESLNQSGSVAPPALDEIENWLFSLAEAEKTAAKQESEKAKSTQQTNPSGASNVRPSTAIPSIVPRLDLGTLVKSPTADDSSEVDDVADSAKNELADITAADAQHSEGSDVKQKSDESLENEKNQQ